MNINPSKEQQPQRDDELRSRVEHPVAEDPVCGAQVELLDTDVRRATYDGVTYDFCSEECRERFEADPARYAQSH